MWLLHGYFSSTLLTNFLDGIYQFYKSSNWYIGKLFVQFCFFLFIAFILHLIVLLWFFSYLNETLLTNQFIKSLSNISRVFKNILNQQIFVHFKNIFSKQQTGFRRSFNPRHCLSVILEKLLKHQIRVGTLLCYLQICQKHLTAYLMT